MKKNILIVLILLLVGCKREDYYTCTLDINNTHQNYVLKAEYKVYYNDNYVTRIEKEENYISDDKEVIDYFEEYNNLDYENLNNLYGGYTYKIDRADNNLIINSVIDLNNVDIKFMVKNGDLDKNYTSSNKLTVTGARYLYKQKGAICE